MLVQTCWQALVLFDMHSSLSIKCRNIYDLMEFPIYCINNTIACASVAVEGVSRVAAAYVTANGVVTILLTCCCACHTLIGIYKKYIDKPTLTVIISYMYSNIL